LYHQLVGRTASAAEINAWVSLLDSNQLTQSHVLLAFVQSPEFDGHIHNRALVDLLYLAFLQRAPDAAGEAGWLSVLSKNPSGDYWTLLSVVKGFISSPEYLGE
jgi:hypothetical protein